jgi:protein-L-isoaspartate O-methyltransferase
MNTPTILTWKPAPGFQTTVLRTAGLRADDLRAAGFRWAKSGQWEASDTPEAAAIRDRLVAAAQHAAAAITGAAVPAPVPAPAHDEAGVLAEQPSALDRALADAGAIRAEDGNGVADLQRQADRLATEAHQAVAAIPGGQPVGSVADRNRRERSAEKMRRAGELRDKAAAKLEKARETARGLAQRLEQRAEELCRPRETHTPKKLCYAMNAKLDGARCARGAALLRAWAEDPSRLPDWRPNAEQAVRARRRVTESVANGWHNYLCETTETEPSTDPTILALRRAYPEGEAKPDPRAEIDRLEAAVRFSPIPGFFPTPPALIERMLELADIRQGMLVLEPSAGNGHLAEAAKACGAAVHCCEIHPALSKILKAKALDVIGEDCMAVASAMSTAPYDRVLMNPPFERGQDREHIRRMYDLLKPGGRLVAVCSTGPFHRTHTADMTFRSWLDRIGAEVEDVEDGAFNTSEAFRRTGVSVKLVVADRRAEA